MSDLPQPGYYLVTMDKGAIQLALHIISWENDEWDGFANFQHLRSNGMSRSSLKEALDGRLDKWWSITTRYAGLTYAPITQEKMDVLKKIWGC